MLLTTIMTAMPLILLARGEGDVVATVVTHVVETRVQRYVPSERAPVEEGKLELGLEIRGDAINPGSQISKIEVTEATDDAQTDLTPDQEVLERITNWEISLPPLLGERKGAQARVLRLLLPLKLPARTAKVIRSVRGTLTLSAGGETEDVTVGDIPGKIGELLEDPKLAECGLEIRIIDPKDALAEERNDDAVSFKVGIEVTGNTSLLRTVDVVDENDRSIANGVTLLDYKTHKKVFVHLIHGLDNVPRLKIRFLSGATEVVVPFEASDLKLR